LWYDSDILLHIDTSQVKYLNLFDSMDQPDECRYPLREEGRAGMVVKEKAPFRK
jgi:hypothetical protein